MFEIFPGHAHTHQRSRSRVRIRSPCLGLEWNVYTFLCERNSVITIMLTLTCVHFRHLASSRQSTTFYITHWMIRGGCCRCHRSEVHTICVCVVCVFTCAVQFMHFMKIAEKILEKMSPGICKKNSNRTVTAFSLLPAALKKKKRGKIEKWRMWTQTCDINV